MTVSREITFKVKGQATKDGAGVELLRVIGQPMLMEHDPFLLLDSFRSDNPNDYIAGFPPHPHRGFETVTYLLNGRMRHKDNAGNEGVIERGGVQWMTAGRGIIHSEMPEQEDGMLEGFQLWINLPASHKMTAPAYQEHNDQSIPLETREYATAKVISGVTSHGTKGPINQPLTEPIYLDVTLSAISEFVEPLPDEHNAIIHVINGGLMVNGKTLLPDELGVLSKGDNLTVTALESGARFLLIAAKPLGETIARYGPFVMNTKAELEQAFADYQQGLF